MANLATNNNADMLLIGDMVSSVVGAGALFDADCHLSQANIPYDRLTQLGDLHNAEANFDGYVAGDVTWALPGLDESGNPECIGTVPLFQDTGSAVGNQIYGVYLTDGNADTLLACAALDGAPIPMIDHTGQILITIRWKPIQGGLVISMS